MMLKIKTILNKVLLTAGILLAVASALQAQTKTVNFIDLPFNGILQKARQEQKLVFVDCYTTWCQPCKWMDQYIFTLDQVSDSVNTAFVSLKMDMESKEGRELLKRYQVGAYPTFLILDASGNLVYKFVGARQKDEFLAELEKSKLGDNLVVRMNKRYEAGDRTPGFIRAFIKHKIEQREIEIATRAANAFLDSCATDSISKADSWFMFAKNRYTTYLSFSGSPGFRYFLANWENFVPAMGRDSVESRLSELYFGLTSDCIRGYYQKRIPYSALDFKQYRSFLAKTNLKRRAQYEGMIDMAEAACKGDKVEVSELFANLVGDMDPKNKRLAYDFWAYITSSPIVPIPRLQEISDTVLRTSKDPMLKKMALSYRNRKLN